MRKNLWWGWGWNVVLERGCGILCGYDPVDAVFVELVFRPDEFAVLGPAEETLVVDLDEVLETFGAREVADLLGVEAFTTAFFQIEVFAAALVEPVEKILFGVLGLPVGVVFAEVAAVAVLGVDELEPILQLHHLGFAFASFLGLSSLLVQLGLLWSCQVWCGRLCVGSVIDILVF